MKNSMKISPMKTSPVKTSQPPMSTTHRGKSFGWIIGATLASFLAGSLITGSLMRAHQVRADNNRVFELMIYHAAPGKGAALESIFRDVSKLQAKHGLDVVGYWVPSEVPNGVTNDNAAWTDTFIYLVAHSSIEEAKTNWAALHRDPDFPPYRKAAEPLIKKDHDGYMVDEVYMRPSDFSAMR